LQNKLAKYQLEPLHLPAFYDFLVRGFVLLANLRHLQRASADRLRIKVGDQPKDLAAEGKIDMG
jgi:hypothetical protein